MEKLNLQTNYNTFAEQHNDKVLRLIERVKRKADSCSQRISRTQITDDELDRLLIRYQAYMTIINCKARLMLGDARYEH